MDFLTSIGTLLVTSFVVFVDCIHAKGRSPGF